MTAPTRFDLDQVMRQARDDDRRRWPRREAEEYRTWLGWYAAQEFCTVAAAIDNISKGGALLIATQPPPVGTPEWLALHSETWGGAHRGLVLEVVGEAPEECKVRVRFDGLCPDRLYHVAVMGLSRN